MESIHEISKELAKSYLDKTVDPVYGMPKHGMKDRMKGIRQASTRVLKKAGKPKTNQSLDNMFGGPGGGVGKLGIRK